MTTIADRIFDACTSASDVHDVALVRCVSSVPDFDKGNVVFTFHDGSRIKYTADVDCAQVL